MADFQEEAQAYDIRNDKAMSRLQAATNEKGAYRDRAVFMRSPCLAGIAGAMSNRDTQRRGLLHA